MKNRFIFTSLIVFTGLLISHFAAAEYFWRIKAMPMNQWESTVYSREEYLCGDRKYNVILTGSSLTQRLDIPNDWLNLGIASKNALTSLEMLTQNTPSTDAVFIEINQIGEVDFEVSSDDLLSFVPQFGKVRGFRSESRTSQMILKSLHIAEIKTSVPFLSQPLFKPRSQMAKKSVDTLREQKKEREQKREEIQRKFLARDSLTEREKQRVDEQIKRVEEYANRLGEIGIRLILIEFPLEQSLYKTRRDKYRREQIKSVFANNATVDIFHELDWNEFETTDGIHLDKVSCRLLINEMENYLRSNSSIPDE